MQTKLKHLMIAPGPEHASWLITAVWVMSEDLRRWSSLYVHPRPQSNLFLSLFLAVPWKESFAASKDAMLISYSGHQEVGVGLKYDPCSACSSCYVSVAKKEDFCHIQQAWDKSNTDRTRISLLNSARKDTSNFQKFSNIAKQFLSFDRISIPAY